MSDNFDNEPLNVGILIFDEVEVLDFCGPFEVFSITRRANQDEQNKPFAVFTVAEKAGIIRARGGLQVQPHFTLENHPPIDVLVVPGGYGTRKEIDNPAVINWLNKTVRETRYNTSVCTGSFLLAKVALLDNHKATTHWASLDRMSEAFPKLEVVRDVRWVDEGNIITSAGVSAGIDMSLHLVEKIFGQAVAENSARQMEYTWDRTS